MRTVSGTFQTTYWPDDGSKTTVSSPPPEGYTAKAILVPETSAAGYTTIQFVLDSNQSFSLPDVPAGPYFLQLDRKAVALCQGCPGGAPQEEVVLTQLIELRRDSPDLTALSAARPDVAHAAPSQFVLHLDVTGLAPWVSGDSILTASSQGFHYGRMAPSRPAAGTTAAGGSWVLFSEGLPDASKGDVFYVYQRSTTPIGSGVSAGTVVAASRYARLTDLTMTLSTSSLSLTLTDSAAQTGAVRADVRYSQFAALAPSVHPSALPATNGVGFSVQAVPHSVEYPDMPSIFEHTGLLILNNLQTVTADADYGTLHYGEFLDPLWKTYRFVAYTFDAQVPFAGGAARMGAASVTSIVPMPADPGPIVPVLSPPTEPRIEGRDAFAEQEGVGLQPTISWSPPAIGHATSYQVTVARQTQPVIAGETRFLSAIVYSGRTFRLPPGFLKQGSRYTATISARSGPWDAFDHAPFREGIPFHTADCITGIFIP